MKKNKKKFSSFYFSRFSFPSNALAQLSNTIICVLNLQDVQLLTLKSVKGIIKGFADDKSRDGFMARFRHTLDFWCCRKVKEGEDGGWAYARDFSEPW